MFLQFTPVIDKESTALSQLQINTQAYVYT